jgi:tRNA(Arg) A34 adenosine deaminase TadA
MPLERDGPPQLEVQMSRKPQPYLSSAMRRAIALSRKAMRSPNDPFGAVVVRDGVVIGEGFNQAAELLDPTAHAEVQAVRDACRRIGSLDLTGADMYASCEPCAVCISAMTAAGIRRLYFGVSLKECDAIYAALPSEPGPASSALIRKAAGAPKGRGVIKSTRQMPEEAAAAVSAWANKKKRLRS